MEDQEEHSEENYKQKKEEMMQYFKESEAFLEAQVKHQSKLTELEELRARYIRAQIAIAQITAPPPDQKKEDPKVRSLRKE